MIHRVRNAPSYSGRTVIALSSAAFDFSFSGDSLSHKNLFVNTSDPLWMHGFSGFCAPDAMCTKTRGLRGVKKIDIFLKTEYNQLLKGHIFAYEGYAMGNDGY